MLGSPNPNSLLGPVIRIGQQLKSNQSITISDHQTVQGFQNKSSYGTDAYFKQDHNKLLSKTILLSSEVERLTRLSQDLQGKILSLTQQLQIKATDIEGFRTRETILQQELSKLQVEDKQLLTKNHKLQQSMLEKNRIVNQLEEQINIYRSKTPVFNKDTSDEKTIRIKQLQETISNEKSKFNDLERQLREALLVVERGEARINAKSENDRVLLMNAEKKILDLEEQLRKYVAEKQRLEQNELRFKQQQITLETTKTFEYTKHVQQLQIINNDLILQKQKTSEHIREVQKLLSEAMSTIAELKLRVAQSSQHLKQISALQNDLNYLNNKMMEKDGLLSQINISKSDLQYKLQTTTMELRRLQGVYTHLQNQSCKGCHQLQCDISALQGKIKWMEELMQKKEGEYKVTIQKAEKELKNLRQLLDSVNNLKGSNERVSKLIEISTQKLLRPSHSNKTFSLS